MSWLPAASIYKRSLPRGTLRGKPGVLLYPMTGLYSASGTGWKEYWTTIQEISVPQAMEDLAPMPLGRDGESSSGHLWRSRQCRHQHFLKIANLQLQASVLTDTIIWFIHILLSFPVSKNHHLSWKGCCMQYTFSSGQWLHIILWDTSWWYKMAHEGNLWKIPPAADLLFPHRAYLPGLMGHAFQTISEKNVISHETGCTKRNIFST